MARAARARRSEMARAVSAFQQIFFWKSVGTEELTERGFTVNFFWEKRKKSEKLKDFCLQVCAKFVTL